MVFYVLKDKMKIDEDERVRYEVVKFFIFVGKFNIYVMYYIGSCVKNFYVYFCFILIVIFYDLLIYVYDVL